MNVAINKDSIDLAAGSQLPNQSNVNTFACNRSFAYRDKRKVRKGINTGYFPVVWTPQEMIDHLKKGFAITTGFYGKVDTFGYPKTDTEHWVSSRLLIIDCDHTAAMDLNKDSFVRQYALCVYATPSTTPEQPRSRAIFLLDTPIKSRKQYKLLAETLVRYTMMDYKADTNAMKLTQRVYGSRKAHFFEYPLNVLPLKVMSQQVNNYLAEVRYFGFGQEQTNSIKVATGSDAFHLHSQNANSVLAGDTLLEGERNNRVNEAAYNLTIRGMSATDIMRKVLPKGTASGLGIKETERSIESGIKGAIRDAKNREYVDNRHAMSDDAKRMLLSVINYDWQSGYTAMVAVAMCKMFAKQGQGFYLTNSLIQTMTGFDAKTVKKHLKLILKSKLFFEARARNSTYYAKPTTDATALHINGHDHHITINTFAALLENDNRQPTLTPCQLKTLFEIWQGRNQRQTISYSRQYAQETLTVFRSRLILKRAGVRYVFVSLAGVERAPTENTYDIVMGKSTPRNEIVLKSHHFRYQKDEIEAQNSLKNQLIGLHKE